MNFWQATLYFLREAAIGMLRDWRTSLVAILTIALGLFVSGLFYSVTKSLGAGLEKLSGDPVVVIYLEPGEDLGSEAAREVHARVSEAAWVRDVSETTAEAAVLRFSQAYPGLSDVAEEVGSSPFPASLEATLEPAAIDEAAFAEWSTALLAMPVVSMVDDDRQWLGQMARLLSIVRAVGVALSVALLLAAVLTTAGVIRLAAFRYLDEIAVMRMVGATEFYIRGPFYFEAALQGALGGLFALLGLRGVQAGLAAQAGASPWLPFLQFEPLAWSGQLAVVLLGALAGAFGAVLSLRRENLRIEE